MGKSTNRRSTRAEPESGLPANPPQSWPYVEDDRQTEEIIKDGLSHRITEELRRRVDQLTREHPKTSRKRLMRQEIGRMKERIERLKRENPQSDLEILTGQLVAELKKPYKRLRRKHPGIEPKMLAYYLSKPRDEQPLWLNCGMDAEDREKVINEYVKFARSARMAPPLKAPGNHADRAVKRQTMLTFKQWQVARFTVDGLDIKEISGRLKVSERMVKTHLQAIKRKAHLDRNAKIVLWFLGY